MPDFSQAVLGQAPMQGGANFYAATVPNPPQPFQSNLPAAQQTLNLSPAEIALYQRHLTNLLGPGGVDNPPDEQNPQGSRSTLYQAVQEHNGKFYSVPTVWDGKRETEPYKRRDGTTMDVPNATALAKIEKAGWDNFPSYSTPDEADSRYEAMHKFIDQDTSQYLSARK